ncbi:MAG: hypothetical protein COB85_08740 [Bacteroidetes bacterium]|nr:MAG: hypothetical protein COB85_08740 [Bacteroidota bacterium]
MTKSILSKASKKIRFSSVAIILSLALGLIMINKTVFAQTNAQRLEIQAATNIAVLTQLSTDFQSVSTQEKILAEQWATDNGFPIKGVVDGSFWEIQKLDGNSGIPQYYITNNLNAAKTISTNNVWSGGSAGLNLSGLNMTIGEWDGPIISMLPNTELGSRLTQVDISGNASDDFPHPLHVAGTMIAQGLDANARGMANLAEITCYDWNSDQSEMATEASNGMLFSNHSYGFTRGWVFSGGNWFWVGNVSVSTTEDNLFGFYDIYPQQWDQIANNAPFYLIVKSAGNDRGQGPAPGTAHFYWNGSAWTASTVTREIDGGTDGYDCLDQIGVAKNILTVGAVQDVPTGYSVPADVVMTSFSSWGPTDDGRIKPDIVANGDCLYSLWNGFNITGCAGSCNGQSYCEISGTSMAAPSVTGSLALLQEHYSNTRDGAFMMAASLKALVIESADEAGANDGPDYQHGWGLINTETAARLITLDESEPLTIQELTLDPGQTIDIEFPYSGNSAFLSVTIVWNDPAGTPPANSLNPADKMLVNDLDLKLTDQSSTITLPWTLDPTPGNEGNAAVQADNIVDNVEQVRIYGAASGTYTATITHKGTLQGGLSQDFCIVINEVGPVCVAGIDLYMRDQPKDYGIEPNPVTGNRYHISKDIWIRYQDDDGIIGQGAEHTTINPIWVYVRVRNNGCTASLGTGTDELKVYWTRSNSALGDWDNSWVNFFYDWGFGSVLTGDILGTVTIPALNPGESIVLKLDWFAPDPADFGETESHICLAARIETSGTSPYGMTFTEGNLIYLNTKNNNNIIWKNITLVNANTSDKKGLIVGNPFNVRTDFDFLFKVPDEELSKPFTDKGMISIDLGKDVYDKWVQGGKKGSGFEAGKFSHMSPTGIEHHHSLNHFPNATSPYNIIISGPDAKLENMTFEARELDKIKVQFNFHAQPKGSNKDFNYDILEATEDGKVLGGMRYTIRVPDCVIPDAGQDVTIGRRCTTTLTASPIITGAVYTWFENSTGNFIGMGESIQVSPSKTTSYELQMASPNGCQGYDVVTVKVDSDNNIACGNDITPPGCFKDMEAFPNPAMNGDNLHVKFKVMESANINIRLVDMQGRVWEKENRIYKPGPAERIIPLYRVPPGVYELIVACKGKVEKRIIRKM